MVWVGMKARLQRRLILIDIEWRNSFINIDGYCAFTKIFLVVFMARNFTTILQKEGEFTMQDSRARFAVEKSTIFWAELEMWDLEVSVRHSLFGSIYTDLLSWGRRDFIGILLLWNTLLRLKRAIR